MIMSGFDGVAIETELEERRKRADFRTFRWKCLAGASQDGLDALEGDNLEGWLERTGYFADWTTDTPPADETPRFSYCLWDSAKAPVRKGAAAALPLYAIAMDQHAVHKQVQDIMDLTEPTLLNVTVQRLQHKVFVPSFEALQTLVKSVFDMIANDTADACGSESSCSVCPCRGETYADILFSFRVLAPTFHTDGGGPRTTFTRVLLDTTQDAFEAACQKYAEAEKAGAAEQSERDGAGHNLVAVVSFVGHLYVRGLVAARVVSQVVCDLVGVRDCQPDERLMECVCVLTEVIGKSMDANKGGRELVTRFLARLGSLARESRRDTGEAVYSEGVHERIRAVTAARRAGWPRQAGTQILVQYHAVTEDVAVSVWNDLKKKGQLTPADMQKHAPIGDNEDAGKHLRIRGTISGTDIGVLALHNADAEQESPLKAEISKITSIHADRLMVLKDDGSPLQDAVQTPAARRERA